MDFYIDSANIEEIKSANKRGWVDGVTTNPSLIAKTGLSNESVIENICNEVSGPVSAEVNSLTANEMFEEGLKLSKIAPNVVVKIPMCEEGLIAVRRFTAEGIQTNITLIFSPLQALLGFKAGATMISPFVGRLDDVGSEGLAMVNQIIQIRETYGFDTRILVASARHPMHVLDSSLIGADIITLPYKVMQQLTHHPLTDKGIAQFRADFEKSNTK